ncbi:bifunctional purine biosynthesis protein PURH [Ditylenchus destructor]|nr:bifunctional purine biosynthesis protein PURH [Ditylenchus destructor]
MCQRQPCGTGNAVIHQMWLRQQDRILNLPWKPNVRRSEKSNVIDMLVSGMMFDLSPSNATTPSTLAPNANGQVNGTTSFEQWANIYFTDPVQPISMEERRAWLNTLTDASVSSDAFFPFRDNIDCARQFGAKYIASPGGSNRDEEIIEACDEHDLVLIHTGVRLFHH